MPEKAPFSVKAIGFDTSGEIAVTERVHVLQKQAESDFLKNLKYAKLTPEQVSQARTVETAAREYLTSKMKRLGVPEDHPFNFPKIQHALQRKKDREEHTVGFYGTFSNVPVNFADGSHDFFDAFSVIAHELSHASVTREARAYPPEKDKDKIVVAGGADTVGNREVVAREIEEGLTIFDQVDFFNTYLKQNFSAEFQRRWNWAHTSERIKAQFRRIDTSLYGSFDAEDAVPFVIAHGLRIPIIGKTIDRPDLDVGSLREFLFIRKLCELVGANDLRKTGEDFDRDKAVKTGRDILDKERYLRNHEGHRKIVETLRREIPLNERMKEFAEKRQIPIEKAREKFALIEGGKRAKDLFHLKDHDARIDNGMRILLEREREIAKELAQKTEIMPIDKQEEKIQEETKKEEEQKPTVIPMPQQTPAEEEEEARPKAA